MATKEHLLLNSSSSSSSSSSSFVVFLVCNLLLSHAVIAKHPISVCPINPFSFFPLFASISLTSPPLWLILILVVFLLGIHRTLRLGRRRTSAMLILRGTLFCNIIFLFYLLFLFESVFNCWVYTLLDIPHAGSLILTCRITDPGDKIHTSIDW